MSALELLGTLVGMVALSIALWLQMVSTRKVPAKYILGFAAIGILVILANMTGLGVEPPVAETIRAIALTLGLIGEIAAAYWIYRHESVEDASRRRAFMEFIR